ncbi:hypothetical protein [Brevundimonas nasdae]|uniref:Uncharacterized protein n=1 Tax=Brevundimonas nasdae TaxID=172043 RepID=A0ABX8TKY6_9CAUL|nr:hypothetical protein [Brevundimonas nasdae]QYC11487.1 hypothetical protein KWG56_05790 [Brevundimonas nasdae]QYC14275.1 hypothetical protein KWG63_01125 [Brevundimonas nasdae]
MAGLVPIRSNELIDPQAQLLVSFLEQMGLPSENIIADQSQRAIIGTNLGELIASIPAEHRKDARYLSKFVIGAGFGLFDYSLNAIWNEVVLKLRAKAVMYGLDIFFDAAVGGSKARELYSTEEHLSALKDSVLLDSCRKLELISDTTYKKLKHILDMRNDNGISHPTTYSINAFELLGYLQNCVQDVLNENPTAAALQLQSFVANLKTLNGPLDPTAKASIEAKIIELPTHLCGNLIRTVFGLYVAPETDPAVRKNITLFAPKLWAACDDDTKFKLGIVLEGYNVNLYKDKHALGAQFFEVVGGQAFRSPSERAIIIDGLITNLLNTHNAWDNFHHEPSVALELASYVPDQGAVIEHLANRMFTVVMTCRLGNGVAYNSGVSPGAKGFYDQILAIAGDKYAPHVMASLSSSYEIKARLSNERCRAQAHKALQVVRGVVINQRIAECLDYLIARIETDSCCVNSIEFQKLSAGYIKWG